MPDTSTVAESPTITSRSAIVPTATGARFGTTTRKLCCAFSPVGSVAVIVTSAFPGEMAVTVTVLPVATAVTIPGSELTSRKSSMSSSGSSKQKLTVAVSPTNRVCSGIDPHRPGGCGLSQAAKHKTIASAIDTRTL